MSKAKEKAGKKEGGKELELKAASTVEPRLQSPAIKIPFSSLIAINENSPRMILRTRYPFRAAKSFLLILRRCMATEAVFVDAPTRYFPHGFTIPSARTFSTQEQATISNHSKSPKSPKISYPHLGTDYRVGWQWKLIKQVDKNGQPNASIVISFKGVGDNTEGFIVWVCPIFMYECHW